MAKRPIFLVSRNELSIGKKKEIDFTWFPGFAVSQQQKSIQSLHENALARDSKLKILEISSKSPDNLGVQLSAFNLQINTKNNHSFSVETAFQASKVFENGGPFEDLYFKTSREAKKDQRLHNSGKLIGFRYFNRDIPTEPKTLFYNWLYINALHLDKKSSKDILEYNAFTDIAFNPQKSINCQAEAAAIYVSLVHQKLIEEALSSIEKFTEIVYPSFEKKEKESEKNSVEFIQEKLF